MQVLETESRQEGRLRVTRRLANRWRYLANDVTCRCDWSKREDDSTSHRDGRQIGKK
ncbi:unnamed protein product [Larinioides sclopetarius]|uniref:Uncharacterized protein n=1 Tax=Larinioides sclopetarius TaxID=280406 RepID=A0AAV2B5S6_9ARAC